jgi:hypothetical protein
MEILSEDLFTCLYSWRADAMACELISVGAVHPKNLTHSKTYYLEEHWLQGVLQAPLIARSCERGLTT